MPSFEFIGTKGSGPAQKYLYRDPAGQVIEVPAELANPQDRLGAEDKHRSELMHQEAVNATRAQAREASGSHAARGYDGPIADLYPMPNVPIRPDGTADYGRATLPGSPELIRSRQYNQDIDQAELHRRDNAFRAAALQALPSRQPGPSPVMTPDTSPPVVGPPPDEKLQRQPVLDDLLQRSRLVFPGQSQARSPEADTMVQRRRALDDLIAKYKKAR